MTVPGAEIVLMLPAPPSANALYLVRGRRRTKSPRYRKWLEAAGWAVQLQRNGCIGGPWECEITLPAKLRGDVDNRIKGILDLLVRHRVVDDDRHCRKVAVKKDGDAEAVLVTLRAAS